ncbi:hypothetical protein V492_04418, partial [Pseudogymnoascus sp. VKM F-4246]
RLRQRPAHLRVPCCVSGAETEGSVETAFAEEGVGEEGVADGGAVGDGAEGEGAGYFWGVVVFVLGLAEGGDYVPGAVGPGGHEERALHVSGHGEAAPAVAAVEGEGELPDEICCWVGGEGDAEAEVSFGAEEALEGYAGCGIGEGSCYFFLGDGGVCEGREDQSDGQIGAGAGHDGYR